MTGKRIKSNIDAFAKILFDLISEDSNKGYVRLISLFEKTCMRYKEEGFWRERELDFNLAAAELEAFPDVINRLQVLANFVSTGGWKINSANTILFFELIHASGYKRAHWETDIYLHAQVIMDLKESLCELIVQCVLDYDAGVKAADLKQQQLKEMRAIKPQNLVNILLCDTHELARESVLANPEKNTFCLVRGPVEVDKPAIWHVFWYDLHCRANFLPLGNELRSLLASLKLDKLPNPNVDSYDQIKVGCSELIKDLDNFYLFDNAETAGKFSRGYPGKHSLCLSKVSSATDSNVFKWQFTWYDMQGKPNHLSIDEELAKTLHALQDDQLPASDTAVHYLIKQQCARVVKELVSKVQVLVNPGKETLKGLAGTYVLTWLLPDLKLQWYDKLGICQDITLSKYPALHVWLKSQLALTPEFHSQLRNYLMHLNVRREVDDKKQVNVLEFLQKKHGITLIAANDLLKIPAYKLVAGVYVLMREPLNNTGEWVLYLRQKGGVNERINIDNWESFHHILQEKKDVMPDDLNLATRNLLRDAIISISSQSQSKDEKIHPEKGKKLDMKNYSAVCGFFGATTGNEEATAVSTDTLTNS